MVQRSCLQGELPMRKAVEKILICCFHENMRSSKKIKNQNKCRYSWRCRKSACFGAEGIGLLEQAMFYGSILKNLYSCFAMIVSKRSRKKKRFGWTLPVAKTSIKGSEAMDVRRNNKNLDPPLHEFVPTNWKKEKISIELGFHLMNK